MNWKFDPNVLLILFSKKVFCKHLFCLLLEAQDCRFSIKFCIETYSEDSKINFLGFVASINNGDADVTIDICLFSTHAVKKKSDCRLRQRRCSKRVLVSESEFNTVSFLLLNYSVLLTKGCGNCNCAGMAKISLSTNRNIRDIEVFHLCWFF